MERKSCFRVTRSRQQAEFFAALDGLGAAGSSELVEGAGTMCLDGVFGNEKLRGDLAIAEAAGDQGKDFELACRDAEGPLLGRIGSGGLEGGGFRRDKHFPHHDRFADGFATARDAEAEPDAEGREEDGDERAVDLDGVLDDDEAVFGVLEGGDEEAADETEDEDVALHDGIVKKYTFLLSPKQSSAWFTQMQLHKYGETPIATIVVRCSRAATSQSPCRLMRTYPIIVQKTAHAFCFCEMNVRTNTKQAAMRATKLMLPQTKCIVP